MADGTLPDVVAAVEQLSKRIDAAVDARGRNAFRHYPLTFGMLGTFGIAAVVYGFEHVIDEIPFVAEHPLAILALGVLALLTTGTLYRRISDR